MNVRTVRDWEKIYHLFFQVPGAEGELFLGNYSQEIQSWGQFFTASRISSSSS